MKRILIDIFYGAIIGVANIIPGVSGGTMALVLGFYERLISAIHNISSETIKIFLNALTFKKENIEKLKIESKRIDLIFLVRITAGAIVTVVALAKIMTYLLQNFHDPTYGFFFGLVFVSAIAPYRLIKKKTVSCLLVFIIAVCALLVVSNAASGDTLLERAQLKHEMKINKEYTETYNMKKTGGKNKLDIGKLPFIFLMGVVAISAMILPGVSGSFLLLLMGGYFAILRAIVNRDFPVLVSFAIGCLIGIIVFSRFLNFLLKKWHDQTMSFLLGLVIGSLWMIWPFKTSAKVGEEVIYLINRIPTSFNANEVYTILAAIIGVVIVITLLLVEAKKEKKFN